MKVEVVLHFDFDENEIDYKGQELLDNIREQFEESIIEENFSENCKLISVKFIEDKT